MFWDGNRVSRNEAGQRGQITKGFTHSAVAWSFIVRAEEARGEWKNISSCGGPLSGDAVWGPYYILEPELWLLLWNGQEQHSMLGTLSVRSIQIWRLDGLLRASVAIVQREWGSDHRAEGKIYLGQSERQGSGQKWVKLSLTSTPGNQAKPALWQLLLWEPPQGKSWQ